MKIAIVGGGVAGLTTALQLKKNNLRNSDLTIIADSYDDLVSYVAAGIFRIGNDYSGPSKEITRKWVKDSYDFYWDIWRSRDASKAGIAPISCYMFSNVAPVRHDWMAGVIPTHRDIEPEEFRLVNGDWRFGSYLETLVTQCSFYLPWARSKLEETGTTFLRKKLDSLDELYDDYDLIINCSGLGARSLCQDRRMIPIRGQVARVKAPWMKVCFYAELDTYIIPGFDGYVTLGGTRDFNSVKTDVCRHAYRSIRERCENLLPSLRKAPTVQQKVGFRPYREGGVRVEAEKIPAGRRAVGIVHNYGHGGYGVCTAPGCAAFSNHLAEDLHKLSSSKL